MRTSFSWPVLAVLFLTSAVLPAEDLKKDPPKKSDAKIVTMEMLPSRHFLVKVTVDGKGPYSLILDTGAPMNIMTSRLAKDAGLVKKSSGGFGLFGGMNQIVVNKLDVGGVVAEKIPAVVMDHPTVSAISDAFLKDHGPIDGIVGFPFFGRFAMTVDYEKKELLLTPNGYKPGDYMADMMKTMMKMQGKSEAKSLTAGGLWGLSFEDKKKSDEKPGMVVETVFAQSAAEKAGLKKGDRILTIDGRWTDTLADVVIATSLIKAGKTVEVEVESEGKTHTRKVTPVAGR